MRRALAAAAPFAAAAVSALPAYAQTQTFAFRIESQPLSSALLSLGRQADLSIAAPTSLVAGKVGPTVNGQLSASEALEQLLAGSGLTFVFVNGSAVKIVAKDAPPQQRASAADAESEGRTDRVIVTGTNLRGVHPASSPVETYTAGDIARTGAVTTEQFVAKLTQNSGATSQYAVGSTIAGPNLDGVSAIDLRGLGLGSTLTLLNGRRMALSNGGRSADVSLIPASAIKRVEVLTDGASAIYGSDAIGGVVNFILRDDFEGAESRLSVGGVTNGGLRQLDASQTFGGHWDGGHGLAAYNLHAASPLKTSDRDYAILAGPGNLTPVDTRHNVFGTVSQDIGDRLTLNVDLGAGWRKVKNGYSNLTGSTLATQTFARYKSQTDQIFTALALDYELSDDWTTNLAASYSQVDVDGQVSVTRFNLSPPPTVTADYGARNSQLDIMGKVDGVLFTLPGGDLKVSFGGGVLEEQYEGVNPTNSTQIAGELGRRSTYAFGEAYLPLIGPGQAMPFVRRLALNVAARYTDYQETSSPSLGRDFGDSVDPKIGLLWSPIESLNLRGTYGTSFRAPTLTQLDQTSGLHYLLPDTVAGNPAILLTMAGYAAAGLKPETAETFTLGFDFAPVEASDFRLSATYYNIDYTDQIGLAPTGGLNPFASPGLAPDLIYRPPSQSFIEETLRATPLLFNFSDVDVSDPQTGAAALFGRNDVWIFDGRLKNIALSQQDGFDVSIQDRFDTALGDLQLGANVTHILSYRQRGSMTSPTLNVSDVPGQPADWRGRLNAGLSNGPFSGSLSLNYTDDYTNPLAPAGQQKVDSWVTLDGYASFNLGGSASASGPIVSLSIQNLLDEDPPFLLPGSGSNIVYPVGFDPANANPLGRFVVIGLTQRW
ncbi:MAG: TonB-dependent receptor [Hyphomonadaceae bacterium]|nr:TonB-dependent receptor [Hyphomonadaceae bacterium]